MTASPQTLPERPDGDRPGFDLVSDVLQAVRLDGAYFFRVDATEPWRVESRAAREESPQVLPRSEHLIPYHLLVEGECSGGLTAGTARPMRAGSVIVFPHGSPHFMASAPDLRLPLTQAALPPGEQPPFILRFGGDGSRRATFVCGYLGCDRRPFNPLLASLPEVLLVEGQPDSWLATFAARVLEETTARRSGAGALLTRLAELMFIEVVRRHLESLPPAATGWLAALQDDVVHRALALLHEQPAHAWSLDELARRTACSRSVLAERFTQLLGDPPIQYLTRWRMQLASQHLTNAKTKIATIARLVGYESEAAFSRAFKRTVGTSPASWRETKESNPNGSR